MSQKLKPVAYSRMMKSIGKTGAFSQGIGVVLTYDSRDEVYFPWKGFFAKAEAKTYPTFLGTDFTHHFLKLDYRSYFSIKDRVVIAAQVVAHLSFGDVPFHRLPGWGGKYYGRGYLESRYRDSHAVAAQGELRIPAWKRLVFTGIIGAGYVGDDVVDLFKVWKHYPSVGFGGRLRLFKDKDIAVRADLVFWKGTWGFYFVFNEAF